MSDNGVSAIHIIPVLAVVMNVASDARRSPSLLPRSGYNPFTCRGVVAAAQSQPLYNIINGHVRISLL